MQSQEARVSVKREKHRVVKALVCVCGTWNFKSKSKTKTQAIPHHKMVTEGYVYMFWIVLLLWGEEGLS